MGYAAGAVLSSRQAVRTLAGRPVCAGSVACTWVAEVFGPCRGDWWQEDAGC